MSVHVHYCPLLHGNNQAHNALVTKDASQDCWADNLSAQVDDPEAYVI